MIQRSLSCEHTGRITVDNRPCGCVVHTTVSCGKRIVSCFNHPPEALHNLFGRMP